MIELVFNSDVSLSDQICQQITDYILAEELTKDDRLPPIRQLAGDLEVNHNTIAKAYRNLEDQGYLFTDGRRGTRVAAKAKEKIFKDRTFAIENEMKNNIRNLFDLGLKKKEVEQKLLEIFRGIDG